MSESIASLMKKLKLSRSGVEMRMSRIPNFRKKYTHKNGKNLIISNKGALLIMGDNALKANVTDHNTSHIINITTVIYLKKMLNRDKQSITGLQKQLDTANSSNKHLGKLLDQQQQLQLADQETLRRLRGQIKRLRGVSSPTNKNTNSSENIPKKPNSEPKPSFWQRLFGKH